MRALQNFQFFFGLLPEEYTPHSTGQVSEIAQKGWFCGALSILEPV